MSNPYYPPDQSAYPTGLPGFSLRRSSYTSNSATPGNYGRSGATFQQLLNSTNADGADSNGANNHASLRHPYASHNSSTASLDAGNDDENDPMWSGLNTSDSALLRLMGSRSHQLPSFSRAFEPFLRGSGYDPTGPVTTTTTETNTGFFKPSYLRDSVYVKRLEDQYHAKLKAARDNQQIRQPSTQPNPIGPGGGGTVLGGSIFGGGGRPNMPTALLNGGDGLSSLSSYASMTGISINNGAGVVGNGKIGGSGSHRGLTYDVVEKSLPGGSSSNTGNTGPGSLEDDEPLAPLPSRWDNDDKASSLRLENNLEVIFVGSPRTVEHSQHSPEAGAVRADHFMPPQCGMYYFEISITEMKASEPMIGIGFSEASAKLSRPPGWEPGSWGYHSDDGNIFTDHGTGKKYGPSFGLGDVVGCGVNFRSGTVFFTKNGENLGVAFRDIKGPNLKLFPSVGLKTTGEKIRANFGQIPFCFDIDEYMKKEQEEVKQQIARTNTDNLAPAANETDLVQQLVLQFLQHDGYVETARAFAKEIKSEKESLNIDSEHPVRGYNIADDEDANKRQRIRQAILEGDIDKALELTNADYPSVLDRNEQVHFSLKCRKFIEMIRREAELNIVGNGTGNNSANANGSGSTNGNGTGTNPGVAGNEARQTNGHGAQMDVDDVMMVEDNSAGGQPMNPAIMNELVKYGQYLQMEFQSDLRPKMKNKLNEVFSLLAYPNPLKQPEVAHLLDRRGRVTVAEELNAAILQSLGQSSRSALENVYAQTSVLLDDLRQNGGPGSFVTIQAVLDDIPQSYNP